MNFSLVFAYILFLYCLPGTKILDYFLIIISANFEVPETASSQATTTLNGGGGPTLRLLLFSLFSVSTSSLTRLV